MGSVQNSGVSELSGYLLTLTPRIHPAHEGFSGKFRFGGLNRLALDEPQASFIEACAVFRAGGENSAHAPIRGRGQSDELAWGVLSGAR